MTPSVLVLLVVLALVLLVAGAATVAVVTVLRQARQRRVRDLTTLSAIGAHLSATGQGGPGAADARWSVAEAVRSHVDAARVVLVVDGHLVVAMAPGAPALPPPAAGHLDLAAAVRPDRPAARWRRGSAPPVVAAGLDARGAGEVLVAPLGRGAVQPEPSSGVVPDPGAECSGVLEVHDPRRSWARRLGAGRWRSDHTAVRGELSLLATVAGQVSAAVENARLSERLRRDAHHDPLTGLLNRAGFLLLATEHLAAGQAAVAVVDFSLLDQVNDTLGHAQGDRFVTLAADRIAAVCASPRAAAVAPGARIAARLEGDTFAVLVAGIGPDVAHRSAQEMREQLVRPYVVEGLPFEPAVAVGVAAAPVPSLAGVEPSSAAALLLARADVALAATRDGGEPVRCYDPRMGERADRRLALIRGFGPSVAQGHLRVHYQPVVSLGERTVLGVEALARWEHPELGDLMPDEFVPILEATGQIGALTTLVLDQALADARRWLDGGMRLSVAVNVSVGVLEDASFPELVADALARHEVPAELLTLELTESGVSSERAVALPVLRRLHALGCRLAVDDFGTGQSSLAHLRRLPVDQVKIDKSFVLGMDSERGDVAVVRAIVEMGHTLGLTVVAEGVEQAAVRTALADMGCDVAQGYLVSRPLPACGLDAWLETLDVRPVGPGSEGGPRQLIA